jgi:hypothetical protein
MKRKALLQDLRKMCFEEAYGGWDSGRLTQPEAAALLGESDRTFRRGSRALCRRPAWSAGRRRAGRAASDAIGPRDRG